MEQFRRWSKAAEEREAEMAGEEFHGPHYDENEIRCDRILERLTIRETLNESFAADLGGES